MHHSTTGSARSAHGLSSSELLIVLAIVGTVAAISVPAVGTAIEHARAVGSARHLAATIQQLRFEAMRRGAVVGIQFTRTAADWQLLTVVDGNANGLRSAELRDGIDRPAGPPSTVSAQFPAIRLAVLYNAPPVEGDAPPIAPGSDPVRIGPSSWLSFSPSGTGTSGSLYLAGPGGTQLAVRVFGSTGRVRVFEYLPANRTWVPR